MEKFTKWQQVVQWYITFSKGSYRCKFFYMNRNFDNKKVEAKLTHIDIQNSTFLTTDITWSVNFVKYWYSGDNKAQKGFYKFKQNWN